MDTIQGRALVASPYLTDPNFLRSVVYMLRHDEEGSIGLILNRPMRSTVGELLAELTEETVVNGQPVYCGGPVDGPLMMLQACHGEQSDCQIVYVASDQQRITSVCAAPNQTSMSMAGYRVFDGYAGWGAGQLENEIQQGGWLVWEIQPTQIFADAEEQWQTALREIGRGILAGGIDPSKIPVDPAYN